MMKKTYEAPKMDVVVVTDVIMDSEIGLLNGGSGSGSGVNWGDLKN